MSEFFLNSSSTHAVKPAWSFMALHSQSGSLVNSTQHSPEQTQRSPISIETKLLDGRTDMSQSSENQTHILAGPFSYRTKEIKPLYTESSISRPDSSVHNGLFLSSLGRVKNNVGSSTFRTSSQGQIKTGHAADHGHPLNTSIGTINGVQSSTIFASRTSPASDSTDSPTAADIKVNNQIIRTTTKENEISLEELNGYSETDSLQRRSRAASVSADHKGMHALVLEAMKTVQKYESENEEQRQELNRLNTLVLDLQTEKRQLVDKVTLIKTTALRKVTASCQALKAQEEDLHSLKLKSKELFSTVGECRRLLQEIHQFKGVVSNSIEAVRIYLDPEKRSQEAISTSPPASLSTRELLSALKNEIMNKQQVVDMLRDRLSDAFSDVSSLRTFAFQMQEAYLSECSASHAANEELTLRETRIFELVTDLDSQRAETLKALTQAAELETKFETSQQQRLDLDNVRKRLEYEIASRSQLEKEADRQEAIHVQKTSLQFLEKITQQNDQLSSNLIGQTERLKSLEASEEMVKTLNNENNRLKNEYMQQESTIRDYEKRLGSFEELSLMNNKLKTQVEEQVSMIQELKLAISSNETTISKLRISLLTSQEKWAGSESLLSRTKEEWAASLQKEALATEAETRMQAYCHQIMTERDALSIQNQDMEQRLATFKEKEIMLATETTSELKSLQERFEDQNVTLRLIREANADLHERLLSATAEHTKTLEESRGAFQKDIAILQERNTSLHTLLEREKVFVDELKGRLIQKETEIQTNLGDNKQHSESMRLRSQHLQEQKDLLETQVNEAEATYQQKYSEFQLKEDAYLREIKELGTKIDIQARNELEMREHHKQGHSESQRQIASLQTRLADMEKSATELPRNYYNQEQEVERLREHIHQIKSENEIARNRILTLSGRYDEGDLDQVEKSFVQKIMKGIQAVHDQEIAKLRNELHRKDGLIVNLQEIKSKLENSLKRKIQKKTPVALKPTFDTSEFINWPTSPSVHSAPSSHPGQPKNEITVMTPVEHGQDIQASPQQSNIYVSPLNAGVVDVTARLRDSNDKLELNTGVPPVQSMKDTGTSPETQKAPKRPVSRGRNTQTYSSKNKRKRR